MRTVASGEGWLNWPALGGRDVPGVGGGEQDAVVIVAIEKYEELAAVAGANVSADDWYDYFTRGLGVPESRVQILKTKATENKMKDAVELAAGQAAQERGRLWFVFIGHGAPSPDDSGGRGKDGLLVDYRAEEDHLTGLRHSTLMGLMGAAARGGQQPVAILDACYSGKLANDEGSGSRSLTGGQMTELRFEPPTPKGVLVLSAAASDQVAYPLPGLPEGRPAFSYLLLGGLRGWADREGDNDGQVTADEAIGFTQFALSQFGREQRPQLQGAGELSLARAGEVPELDVRAYANLFASGGARPGCNDGFEWRDGMCRPQVSTECEAGLSFVPGRGCVAAVDRSCDAGFEWREGRCKPLVSTECARGFEFESGRGCVPVVVASAPAAPAVTPAANVSRAQGVAPGAEDMVRIPAGSFWMGDADVTPVHHVTLAAFDIDRTEVTVAQYAACVRARGCLPAPTTVNWIGLTTQDATRFGSQFCNGNRGDRQDHPTNCVDWPQATAYCAWRDARLPTEAEWEYAARGTDGRRYPWGNEAPDARRLNAFGSEAVQAMKGYGKNWTAMYEASDGNAFTAPVGSYPAGASPFGVLDMAGNVWEWVSDWFVAQNPLDQVQCRVLRGGGLSNDDAVDVRAANRDWYDPGSRYVSLGFRCARGVSP